MKRDSSTSPEYQRFENLLKTVLSVPHSEIKRKLAAEKKAKAQKKKRTKKTTRE